MMMLLAMLPFVGTQAINVLYWHIAGTSGTGDSESSSKLIDGDKSTKWCVTSLGNPTYIEFEVSARFVPKGYVITTGNDTRSNPGRNPRNWTIKAKLSEEDQWTTLTTVTNDTRIPIANTADCVFLLDNSNYYKYFRIEIPAVQGGTIFQLAEFKFLDEDHTYNLSNTVVSGIKDYYSYKGSAITLDYTVKNLLNQTLTNGTHFTAALTKDGTAVSQVQAKGDYTLTLTGKGSYSGTQTVKFSVVDIIPITYKTVEMEDGIYKLNSSTTIWQRIQVNGNVNMILDLGKTLTASDGVEVPEDAIFTIDGTGSLVACPTTDTTYGNGGGKSGIGGFTFGNIIINGGNVTASGYNGGAGIGGDENNWYGGSITINGGVVNATGSQKNNYSIAKSAGIGGGAPSWADQGNTHRGVWSTITINGGQVAADRMGGTNSNVHGTLVMSWTDDTDFIYITDYYADNVIFNKQFVLEGTQTLATASNIKGNKIVPIIIVNIADATISGLSNTYTCTGNPININYTVTCNGNTLTAGTDYTATITKDGVAVTTVQDIGNYTLTLTGKGLYTGTKSVNFSVVGVSMSDLTYSDLHYSADPVYNGYSFGVFCDIRYTSWLAEGTDYDKTFTKNGVVVEEVRDAGDYIVTFTGKGRFVGSVSRTFSIAPRSIADASFSTTSDSIYNGNTFAIYGIYFNGGYSGTNNMKISESDYDLTITKGDSVVSEIRDAGTYILTATGKNNFTGTLTQEFVVQPIDFSTEVYINGLRDSYTSSEDPNSLPYEWNGGYTVKYRGYQDLVEGTDYVVTIVRDGVPVQGVYGIGHFTLTFTGIGNYKNSKTCYCNVQSYKYIGRSGGGWNQSGMPIDPQYEYCLTQMIYTPDELGCAGIFKSISYYNTYNAATRLIDIYMTPTDKTSYSSDYGVYDWVPVDMTNDLVYSGEINFAERAWDEIVLQFPFVYDGQHSVAITVDDKTGSTGSQPCFFYYDTESCQTYQGYNDYRTNTPANPGWGHASSRKPQMEILKEGIPALVMPKDLAVDYQGGTSATTTWVERGTATAWQIGIDDGTSEQIIDVNSQSYTLTNLAYRTSYAIRVRSTDGNGNYSNWTNTYQLKTAFCEPENMCYISFDLTNSIGVTWEANAIEVVDHETGYLLGTLTNDSVSNPVLYEPCTIHVLLAVPAGRTIDFRWVEGGYEAIYCSWTGYDVNGDEFWSGLPYYVGSNGRDSYYHTGDILYSYTVDCTINSYLMPVGLTCTGVTGTTAQIVWKEKGTATAWQICLNDDENNLIQVNDTTHTFTGLTPETIYNVRVRAFGNDGQSRWTQNISFLPSDKLHIGSPEKIEAVVPTNVRSNYCLTEQIYLKEELGSARVFKSIDFFAKNYSSTRDLDIYMVHTDKSTFHVPGADNTYAWIDVTLADKVFSGTVNFEHDVWTTIELDVPFSYNGQDNMLLVVDDNSGRQSEYNYASLFTVYSNLVPQEENGQTRNYLRTLYTTNDLDPTNLSGQSYTDMSFNSEIRLDYLKEGELMRPGFLTASGVTAHTATISWQENGTSTAWQICLNGDEAHPIDVTTNPHTLTTLIPETTYTVKVRSVSGNNHSDWSRSISFLASDKRNIGSGTAYSNYVPTATFSSYSFTEQIYTSAEMGEAGSISSIDFRCQSYPCTRHLVVYMMHTNQSVFNSPYSDCITPSADDIVFDGNVTFATNEWTTLEFDDYFNYDGVSNVVVAVHDKTGQYVNGMPAYFYVYDAGCNQTIYNSSIYGNPEEGASGGSLMSNKNQIRLGYATHTSVLRPTGLTCTTSTLTSATLTWTEQGTATAWQICMNGDDLHPIDVTTNPFTLTGLTPFEDITVKVRSVSGNEYSDWSKTLIVEAAGKILVGSGSDYSYNLPVYSYYNYSMSEQIYTPTDITNAGGSAGSIVHLEYLNKSPEQARDIEVYMKHTTTNSFATASEYIPVTQADKVFSGNVTFRSGVWTDIHLDTPFEYDGQHNLLIVVYDKTGRSCGMTPVCGTTFSTSEDYQTIYCYGSDIVDPTDASTMVNATPSNSKNQLRLSILYEVQCDVNHDGKFSLADVTTAVNLLLSNGYDAAADIDGNGQITKSDIIGLVNRMVNK